MGFVWWVLSMITALGFIFSIIPVYNYNASLNTFYAWEIPSIICDISAQGSVIIDAMSVNMNDICKRNNFPLLTEQAIDVQTNQPILINLAMWQSVILPPQYKWILKRSIEEGIPRYSFNTAIPESNTEQVTNQDTIKQSFLKRKREYLQKNYPWKREYAPTITKIAIRKMRLLSLIDRSYNDKISRLEFYMKEVK